MVGVDDALTTGAAVSELELTFAYSELVPRSRTHEVISDEAVLAGIVTFTHGFAPRLDLAVSTFGVSLREGGGSESRGWGDLFADVKWRFHGNGADGLQVAYRPGLSIPVGKTDQDNAQSPGFGFWAMSQALLVTILEGRWVVGIETGFLLPLGDSGGTRGLGFGSVGGGYQVTRRLKPELELNYLRDFTSGDVDGEILAITAGLIVNSSPTTRIDLGVRHEIWGENVDQSLVGSVNVSVTFGGSSK